MKILLVTSEALPYCKSGGLGDFIFSYSKALKRNNQDVSVILPYYNTIKYKYPETNSEIYDKFFFDMGTHNQGCTVYHHNLHGVDYYFTCMDRFERDGLYGYGDDNERFACFMMAVNTFITRHNDYDVVHCNDWQSAVLPLLLKYNPRQEIKTVLTIHNPAYQGWAKREDLYNYFRLDLGYYDSGYCRLGDSFNFLKTGIMASKKVNTVSKTHADELMYDHDGFGKIGAIIDYCKHNDFVGIVNGLDVDLWDPKTDKLLAKNYSVYDYKEGKEENKKAILKKLGIPYDFNGPLISAITRLSDQKGVDRLMSIFPSLSSYDAKFIVIGTGEKEDEFLYRSLPYKEVYFVKRYDENLAHLLYAASDFFLMPSYFEPCGTSQMISMRYGTVPIVSSVGGLYDTVKDMCMNKEATGYVFNNSDPGAFLSCFKSAMDFYKSKDPLMDTVIRNGMLGDYSWDKSCKEYLNLYSSITW